MIAQISVAILGAGFTTACLYSVWAAFKHCQYGYSGTLLSIAFVTVMMIIVSAFDSETAQVLENALYGETLVRGAIEEAVKVSGLLMFATMPVSANTNTKVCVRNPIWFLAVVIATYENVLIWVGPLFSSMEIGVSAGLEGISHSPAITYFTGPGLLSLTAIGVMRYFIHFYLTALAIVCWHNRQYVFAVFMLLSHGAINVISLAITINADTAKENTMGNAILFTALAFALVAITKVYVGQKQQTAVLPASDHNRYAPENSDGGQHNLQGYHLRQE